MINDLTHGGEEGREDEEHHQDAGVADAAHGPGQAGDQRLSLNSFIRAITHPASVWVLSILRAQEKLETRGNNKLQSQH